MAAGGWRRTETSRACEGTLPPITRYPGPQQRARGGRRQDPPHINCENNVLSSDSYDAGDLRPREESVAMREYLPAIDQAATGTRCTLLDTQGGAVRSAYREHRQILPQPGWVEHDAEEIWSRVDEVIRGAVSDAPPGRVLAVGVTNQRETVVAWDARDGRPAAPAIVWQDTRNAGGCPWAIERGWGPDVLERSGLPISTYFSATKIRWLLDHQPDLRARALAGHLRVGTIDSWVIWNLTGGPRGGAHVTDP